MIGYGRASWFRATTTIPLTPGTFYSWRIKLPCTAPVAFRETMVLPAPTTWSIGDPATEISADKSVATTHADAPCTDGWIEHGWIINGDDPPGEYEITAYYTPTTRDHWRGRLVSKPARVTVYEAEYKLP